MRSVKINNWVYVAGVWRFSGDIVTLDHEDAERLIQCGAAVPWDQDAVNELVETESVGATGRQSVSRFRTREWT